MKKRAHMQALLQNHRYAELHPERENPSTMHIASAQGKTLLSSPMNI